MKKLIIVALVLTLAGEGFAQTSGVVKLRGTRLTYPLVNAWIDAFHREYPSVHVYIRPSAPADSIDFSIASYALGATDVKPGQRSFVVTRYAQLPIVNSRREDLATLQAKGVSNADLKSLFFSPVAEAPPSLLASARANNSLALYVRDRPVCAVKAFSAHVGGDPTKINGIGVSGDDQDLASAVKNDVNGITFNNLGFIYDVKTRHVVDGLAIIPIDLNENGKVDAEEKIYESLDHVIRVIEEDKKNAFINEVVNFIYDPSKQSDAAVIFANWVLTKGQKVVHDYGFISLDPACLQAQREVLRTNAPIASKAACVGLEKVERSSLKQ